ncbi:MAG TPA: hypothetical protein PKV17_16175, partial [Aquabacterium sp.]|nr:hypothetical protein [Aquabacterium sp.]
ERHLDDGEFLDVFAASEGKLSQWFRDGLLTDAKTVVGMMWLQQWRSGAWAPAWVSVADAASGTPASAPE